MTVVNRLPQMNIYLRELLVNSRHPDPRRVWKGGAEPRFVDHIRGIRGIGRDPGDPGDPRDPRMNSRPQILLRTSNEKSTSGPLEDQFSRISKKGATRDPKAAQREPKRAQGRPKASQTGPKAAPKRDKRSPMASQRDPKEPPGTQKGVQRKPIYTKTPDQPHRRPLCY